MPTTFKDIIKFGFQKEVDAESFYRRWAALMDTPDHPWPTAKALLLELAEQESRHHKLFDKIQWGELLRADIPENFDVPLDDDSPPAEPNPDALAKDVILYAIGREDRSMRFYTALAELGGEVGEMFGQLAREEREHKQRLESFQSEHRLACN